MIKRITIGLMLLACSWAFAQSQVVAPLYEFGSEEFVLSREIYDSGILRKSELKLMAMIKDYPYSSAFDKALLLQAEIDLNSGNHSVAISKLSEFIKTRSNSPLVPHAHLQKGYIEFERKNYQASELYFADAMRSAQNNFLLRKDSSYKYIYHYAAYWQAISVSLAGKQLDALPLFENVANETSFGPYSDDAMYAIATIREMNRAYDTAIANYRSLQKQYEGRNTFLASYIREANNHLILRDFRSALLSIERAETINRMIKSQSGEAERYEPQSYVENIGENLLYLRGEAYNLGGNFDLAVTSFEELISQYPQTELLYRAKLGTGWAHLNKNSYTKAIENYDYVINNIESNEDRNRATAQMFRAVALKRQGDTATARKELSALSMLADYPYVGIVLLELGQLNYEAGNFIQARKDLERADREALEGKTAVRVYLLLGATYMELKLYDKAVNEFKKAEQIALNSNIIYLPQKDWYIPEARLKQGIALVLSMRSSEAIKPLLGFLQNSSSDSRADEAMFWLGEAYYRSDMLANSKETFTNLLEKFPKTSRREEVLYGLGWSHFRRKEFELSSKIFDQLVREFPKSSYGVEVLARQGDGYYLVKNYQKAAEAYQKALRLAPNTEDGQYSAYQLAHAYYRMQKYEQSISALLDFVNRYGSSPYSPNALYLIGWIRFQQHKYAECIDNFNFLIAAYPQSSLVPRAYYAIADANYNMGRYEEAINGYRYIVSTFPSSDLAPEAMKSVQYALIALGREAEVIGIADSYIESNPNSPYIEDFKWKRAEMFYTGRKYNDAVSEFNNFIKNYPESERGPEVLYWMGKSYAGMSDNSNAAKTFSELHKKHPQSDYAPLALLEYGLLEKQLNHPLVADSILNILQSSFAKHEAAAQAGFERAVIKFSLLDTLGAINLFKKVANDFPTMDYGDHSRYRVAMYYRSKDMYDSARVHFVILSKIVENPTIASEAQYRLGELAMRQDNYELAIIEFRIVKEQFTGYEDWFSLAILNLGECYEKTNQTEFAREMYTILESLRPEDDFGKTAKSRLKRLK